MCTAMYFLFFQDDNFVLSAIFCAIEENNQEGLDKLLSMANIDVNQTNKHGEGAIHVAAGLGQLDILKMLAAKGGNLGMVDYRGDSAIYWAARQGHEDIIRYLLSQGVHLNRFSLRWTASTCSFSLHLEANLPPQWWQITFSRSPCFFLWMFKL